VPSEFRSAAVPALSLQTLVENSVKFAVGTRSDGAEIHITAFPRDGFIYVEVSDNGPGFAAQDIRPGHGLDNLQRRLTALFGPPAKLEISKKGEFTAVSFCLPQTDGKTTNFHAASVPNR
jgi:LytS/YehU family sensor histidine kinase